MGLTSIVVVFRDQEMNIHEQLDVARYFGPLHKHPTRPTPIEPGLEEVDGSFVLDLAFTLVLTA